MGRQRQLTVDDNTEVASGVRDGDASAEHQDVMAVDLVQQLTRSEPQQLRLGRVQPESARTHPGVDVRDTFSELADCRRNIFDGRAELTWQSSAYICRRRPWRATICSNSAV